MGKKKMIFCFVLRSACTTLAAPKIGCASTMLKQKKDFLFGIVFGLLYLCGHELKPLINLLFCHWLSAYSESAKS